MMAQELLVLRLRSLGETSLKHQPLTTHLLLIPRGKGESSIIKDAASEAGAMKWDVEVEEESAKKKQSSDTQYESPMFVMTPAMARMTKEYTDKLLAEKKQKEAE